jgi:uncharacterized protein
VGKSPADETQRKPALGVSVSKAIAKRASERNYMRRTVREALREYAPQLPALDFVVLVRGGVWWGKRHTPAHRLGTARTTQRIEAMRALLRGVIQAYRYCLSPLLGPNCRFYPSCSEYGLEAISKYGSWRGTAMSIKRVCRCHPRNPGGYDPVP